MKFEVFLIYLAVMAGVTYALRAVPFTLIRKKITNKYINPFLYYIPYTVLAAMVFPAILYATGSVVSAAAGFCVAVVLSFFRKGLLTVALSACAAVIAIELIGML